MTAPRPALAAILVALVAVTGCSPSLEQQQAKLDRFAQSNQYGGSADMWLVRSGLAGPERVALIYGFYPDSEFCFEVAQMYMDKYPAGAKYSCELAN